MREDYRVSYDVRRDEGVMWGLVIENLPGDERVVFGLCDAIGGLSRRFGRSLKKP